MSQTIPKDYFMREITGIRVSLNWAKLLNDEEIEIESTFVNTVNDLGNIYTPWCKDDSNLYCTWDCSQAQAYEC